MNWSGKECVEWLPFVQAVAEGKSILMWTGYMEEVKEGVEYTDNPYHRYKDDKGIEYASRRDSEWNDTCKLSLSGIWRYTIYSL